MSGSRSVRARIHELSDSFAELEGDVLSGDPLAWGGYRDAIARTQERTGELDSIICGFATIGGSKVVVIAFDERFFAGSVGQAGARKIADAFDRARWSGCAVVSLVATGGCRMQEGAAALGMMPTIAAAAAGLRRAGHAHVSVLTGAVHGGLWVSLVAGADVLVGVRGVSASFAGHRVFGAGGASSGTGFDVDDQLASGQLDVVVDETDLPALLGDLVPLLAGGARSGDAPDVPHALGVGALPATGAEAVQRARASERPHADAYLTSYFDLLIEISGDRAGGVDPGMRCGFGRSGDRTIAFVAQTGTANTAAGFRTAARHIRLADALGLPLLLLIDTPGAANDEAAERTGIGAALADVLTCIATSSVPMTSLIIGEGGSGGAIALAAPSALWMTPDSYLSVIAPEAAASILKRGPEEIAATAEQLRLRPQDVVALGIAQGIAAPA